jgi:hypothetical protein
MVVAGSELRLMFDFPAKAAPDHVPQLAVDYVGGGPSTRMSSSRES